MASEREKLVAGRGPLVSESQVEAMISLLTDESPMVVERCRRALRAHAEMAEPLLRERLAETTGAEQTAVVAALLDVVGTRIEEPLVEHLLHAPALEAGSLLIGRLIDPSENPGQVTAALDAMADQLSAELPAVRDAETEVELLTDVMARQNALKGTVVERADPWDAVLHGVTLRQRGLPLALSMTWLLVARRAGVPLLGVNMPGHFLVRHRGGALLDPFHGGRAVQPPQLRELLARAGYPPLAIELLDATDRDMLVRTLRNLVLIAARRGERELAGRCARIVDRVNRAASGAR
ncbi:MAG TPA: transglutaminase-like domain-containing protein [Planctomycetota bacterium]|nr:transglutaminase-like domain-containing protein [Planctomycetota bacterium]